MSRAYSREYSVLSKGLLGYALILVVGAALAAGVYVKHAADYEAAKEYYQTTAGHESIERSEKVGVVFQQIYQGVRTLSLLPSVRSIDRYGKQLDENARETIIQIYNNLRGNVAVSEVYIVPVDLEPEQIDPTTGSLQTPILMFDDGVANHEAEKADDEKITTIAQAEQAKEVEIFEYRALKEQMGYFKAHYPTKASIEKLNLPMLGSPSVLTCDNGDFDKTKQDADRAGIILSVPFYGMDGQLKGAISAIVRDNVFGDLLPATNLALLNRDYNYMVLPKTPGQEQRSREWVEQMKPDPTLIFSDVTEISTPDPRSHWALWAGYPDTQFTESNEAKAVENFRYFGYGFVVLLMVASAVVYSIVLYNLQSAARLKQEAEATRKQSLQSMADTFESSVKNVVARVVSASERMQSGSAEVARIADDTQTRSQVVSQASNTAASASEQLSYAAEKLNMSISEISSQTQRSSNVAQDAANQAFTAKQAIEMLSQQSERVGEIVGVINSISGKINLLALNATIESARAGEAGRGFAVVANEVKQLASQVGQATGEISGQIAEMQSATRASVDSVLQVMTTIDEVTGSIRSVAEAVEEQSAVTNAIAQNIARTAAGAQEISQNIGAVQKDAHQTEKTAQEVLQSARELREQSHVLEEKMEHFLHTVRGS